MAIKKVEDGNADLRDRKVAGKCPLCGARFEWIGSDGEHRQAQAIEDSIWSTTRVVWNTIRCPDCTSLVVGEYARADQ